MIDSTSSFAIKEAMNDEGTAMRAELQALRMMRVGGEALLLRVPQR